MIIIHVFNWIAILMISLKNANNNYIIGAVFIESHWLIHIVWFHICLFCVIFFFSKSNKYSISTCWIRIYFNNLQINLNNIWSTWRMPCEFPMEWIPYRWDLPINNSDKCTIIWLHMIRAAKKNIHIHPSIDPSITQQNHRHSSDFSVKKKLKVNQIYSFK